ncbi:sugar phosphate permease [Stackebrandtia endophytica]|uniref:Sugar phosphate permease n=1 Tax=Stackebrandtia endophytica TaxID=1496996 RepID=A0A543AUT3_9ACTN|nr:MFS transporter [Stackebrandtia endophytica]TQL76307.1 sugar phosphate permease [Stackebrandtia endophytica]
MTTTELRPSRHRIHPAWWVAAVGFLTIIGAAAIRAAPSVLIDPLHVHFGWSHSAISLAITVNLVLYGVIAPFSAALMDRFGMRKIVAFALTMISAGSIFAVFMKSSWELIVYWGVMVGMGTGCMAMAFAATIATRWFTARRGLVTGILTAAGATGQLVFLPLFANLATTAGWQTVSWTAGLTALAVAPLVLWLVRDRPEDIGVMPYGATEAVEVVIPTINPAKRAIGVLVSASRHRTFWFLAGGFAICGASTNGLVGTHFVAATGDHGMPATVGAGLLALIGIFDVIGTIASGWLTDRFDSRRLLAVYYGLRGLSLLFLPALLADSLQPPMLFFIIFYGLDWIATVPPTVALCRQHFGDADGPIVFGWVLAAHQVGAGAIALAAGIIRDELGSYDLAWYIAGALCAVAAFLSLRIRRFTSVAPPQAAPVPRR